MSLYQLADFVVDMQNRYNTIEKRCAQYAYSGDQPADFTVRVTDDEIARERLVFGGESTDSYFEFICAYRNLCLQLPAHDAFLLHGCTISCKGHGIIFTAKSGVGKTTHMRLWKQVYGDAVTVINGDKPIIRFKDDVPYAYGTPWAGKEGYQINDKVKVTDICFIERAEENSVEKANKEEYINFIMQQVLHPTDPLMAIRSLELLDQLLSGCNLWVIKCNVSEQAARLAYNTIVGGTDK